MQVLAELLGVRQLPKTSPVQAPLGAGEARFDGSKIHSYLWHVEQLVSCSTPAILYSFTRRSPMPGSSDGRSYAMLKTWSFGRTYFAGFLWQSRHQLICRLFSWYMSGIRST